MKLSIIIPVYNEEKTIEAILQKVISANIPVEKKEIIIVNDGSTDNTAEILTKLAKRFRQVKVLSHDSNFGKGSAVRSGINLATGDYIVIQDADLEYNPDDIASLVIPVEEKRAEVVYGTRLNRKPNFSRDERTTRFFVHYLGNKVLSLLTSILYFNWLTDMESGYKLFPKKAVNGISLKAKGFEFEPEITAKLLKSGYKIIEIPISTNPRTSDEGKKLNTIKDGKKALWALIKYRFVD